MASGDPKTEQQLTDLLARDVDIDMAILFGSVAAGRPRADSDVDIALLTRRPLDADRKRALTTAIAAVTGRPVDLVDLRTAGVEIIGIVLRTGRRLLCREPRLWADLVARNLVDSADFLPYRERLLTERRQAWIR
jgi:predicted nucleotidyltransferase